MFNENDVDCVLDLHFFPSFCNRAGGVTQHDPLSSTHDACSRVLQVREETKINQRNRKVNNSRSWESGLSHPTSASLM